VSPELRDLEQITALYRAVAAVPGGLARTSGEIDEHYVGHNLRASLQRGVCRIARIDGKIVGEIHAYRPGLTVFSHVLSDLTIAVSPDYQGRGLGRALFRSLLAEVVANQPDIRRVELIARESNERAIQFYESLGFKKEGRMEGRIRSVAGGFEADIPMAWMRDQARAQ